MLAEAVQTTLEEGIPLEEVTFCVVDLETTGATPGFAKITEIGAATCPRCRGDLITRRSKRGRTFYGCANYPECEWSSWKRPLPQPCPHCGGMLVQKNRQWAQCLACEEQVELDRLPGTTPESESPEPELAMI